ncbi:hypothetical protein Saso_35990 [Streptomyces asoensis]|uniref:Uncharacterized protein n=1 Tax=Streptomyces asoensis TaxID=249586 RepID=A0ABQ3S1G3_9ACTN|nr:hypothetical protein GCM10010496_43980 [Streptomyces asoensis]GHI61949.1 hypothetical protein Saso_35990 [Streptomyces asoensis]
MHPPHQPLPLQYGQVPAHGHLRDPEPLRELGHGHPRPTPPGVEPAFLGVPLNEPKGQIKTVRDIHDPISITPMFE